MHHSIPFQLSRTAMLVQMALAASLFAGACLPAAAAEQDEVLPSIEVKAQAERDAYAARRAASATKTDTALRDIPLSITVIPEALIKDLAMQSMADVARYVPGIGMANGEGNRDSPIFRGSASASGDFYINGVRDDVEYYRDLYNIERVEALTGPNAMIFGRGGSGGVINRVSKQANWSTVRQADLTLGSYQNRRVGIDLGQALNDRMAVRVTGMVEDSGGFQRNASVQRAGINPTLAIRVGNDTSVVLGVEHFEDQRAADRGVPSFKGRPLNLPVDAFFGDPNPDSRPIRLSANSFNATVEHELSATVHLSNKTQFTDYDKSYQNFNAGALNAAGTVLPITAYNNHQWRKNLFNQTDLVFDLASGAIKHKVLLGMELGQQDTDYLRKTGVFSNNGTSINVPLASADAALPVNFVLGGSNSDRDGSSRARVAGIYAQDQMALNDTLQLVGGVRFDSFNLDYHNNQAAGVKALLPAPADLSSKDNLLSPRLGLIYKPLAAVSLYANYSVASVPRGGDQLSSLNSVNQGLKPEKFINHEAGAKWDLTPDLMATLAIYSLTRKNVAVVNPVTGIADQLVDGMRSRGVEIGVAGNLSRAWSVKGGYAHQNTELLATASATALSGAQVGMVPKNTFSLWNRYDFVPAFGAGLGLISRDAMFASTSNTVTLPGYVRLDGALFYTLNAKLKLQLNVENLLDKRYYTSANGDTNITPGSPRAIRVSAHATF
ncbi:MAG: TonB-dependent siderophore receptor [Pseudomonadota bacterium]